MVTGFNLSHSVFRLVSCGSTVGKCCYALGLELPVLSIGEKHVTSALIFMRIPGHHQQC